MKSRLTPVLHAASALAIAYLATGLALAQSAGTSSIGAARQVAAVSANDVEQIEQVVVTARRVEERLQDVPISITVFNQQQLSNRNVFNASDLARYTPSLSVSNFYGPDNSSFAIRGFTQTLRTAASVGVYFADVVAPRGGGIGTTAGDGAGPGSFFDLQNVQVLKGPQGTLFGRNTTGGAVLLVPTKPTDALEGYLEVSAGNFDMQRVQGVLNVPFSEKVRLRLGFDEQTRDGYENNFSGVGPSTFNNVDYYALRASLDADLTSNLENYTVASFSHSENHGTLAQLFACNPNPAKVAESFFVALGAPCTQVALQQGKGYYAVQSSIGDPLSLNRQWQVINTTTWHVSDNFTIKNVASYAQLKNDLRLVVFGDDFHVPNPVPATFFGLPTSPGAAVLAGQPVTLAISSPPPGFNSNDQYTMTEELQFQGNALDNSLIWQGGVYYELSGPVGLASAEAASYANCNLSVLPPACTNTFGVLVPLLAQFLELGGGDLSQGNISYRNLGLYGQTTYSLTDQLKLTAGLRYTEDLTHGLAEQFVYNFPPNAQTTKCVNTNAILANNCAQSFRKLSDSPTGVVDLDYKPIDEVMLYAKYSRGYRQGGVNPFGGEGFNTYAAEHVNAYEAGAKTTFDGMVPGTFDFALFYNTLTNQQLLVGLANTGNVNLAIAPTSAIANAGRSHIEGAEIESSLVPIDNFRLDLGATYLTSKLDSVQPTVLPPGSPYNLLVVTSTKGQSLPDNPQYKVTVTGTYTLPVDESLGRIDAGATYVYTSKLRNASSPPFEFLPGTELVTLFANWNSIEQSQFSLSFFMTNATGLKYPSFENNFYSVYGFVSRIPGEPRMFGFRLRYDFGQ